MVVSSAVVIGVLVIATVASIVCKGITDVGVVDVIEEADAVDNVHVDSDSAVADAVKIVELSRRFGGSFLLKDLGMKMDAFADSFC